MKTKTPEILEDIRRAELSLMNEFEDKLHVNPDLDRTLVSFQANKKENGHRWYKYKEAFSASLVRYILEKTSLRSGPVLDPFAGVGTSLFAASQAGLDSVGIEILPCSSEIINVRKLIAETDKEQLAGRITRFMKSKSWEAPGPGATFPHLKITSGAFPEKTEAQLGRYLNDLKKVRDKAAKTVLYFGALCILESISFTRKDGQYLRWDSRSGRRAGGKDFNKGPIPSFTEAIQAKLAQIVGDLRPEPTLFDTDMPSDRLGRIDLHSGSCLDVLPTLPTSSFSGVITSPPYCNRYDYTRTYALELAMLGIDESGIRDLRQSLLSCTVENRDKEGLSERFSRRTWSRATTAFNSQELLGLILEHLDYCRAEGLMNNNGIPRMVRNYFFEMALVIVELYRVLKPGSPLVMVNDNVRYQGIHVPVDLILSDFAEKAGFQIEAIWILPKGKGNSSQQMAAHGRQELRKCVYVWRSKGRSAKRSSRTPVQGL